jgi:hypothetical protein
MLSCFLLERKNLENIQLELRYLYLGNSFHKDNCGKKIFLFHSDRSQEGKELELLLELDRNTR